MIFLNSRKIVLVVKRGDLEVGRLKADILMSNNNQGGNDKGQAHHGGG